MRARNPRSPALSTVRAVRSVVDAAWRPMHHILASITRRAVCSGCHARRASHATGRQAATQESLINNGIIIRSSTLATQCRKYAAACRSAGLLAPAVHLVLFLVLYTRVSRVHV